MDPHNITVYILEKRKCDRKLDNLAFDLKKQADDYIEEVIEARVESIDWFINNLATRGVKKGTNWFLKLLEAPRDEQLDFLDDIRKGLKLKQTSELSETPSTLLKSRSSEHKEKPNYSQMSDSEYKAQKMREMAGNLRKHRQDLFKQVEDAPDNSMGTCIKNHMENDGMTREQAEEYCREHLKEPDADEERRRVMEFTEKGRKLPSAKSMFNKLLEKTLK